MKTVKKVKGRGGRPDRVELMVNIDLVSRICRKLKIKELKVCCIIFRASTD